MSAFATSPKNIAQRIEALANPYTDTGSLLGDMEEWVKGRYSITSLEQWVSGIRKLLADEAMSAQEKQAFADYPAIFESVTRVTRSFIRPVDMEKYEADHAAWTKQLADMPAEELNKGERLLKKIVLEKPELWQEIHENERVAGERAHQALPAQVELIEEKLLPLMKELNRNLGIQTKSNHLCRQ